MPSNKIAPEVKIIVEKFLDQNIFPHIVEPDNLLGILVYGSSLTGFSSKNSDIDLLIILREADNTTRGVKYVDDQKVEYFVKPIEKFLSEGVAFTNRNCPSHVALEQNAYILYDQGGVIHNFLNADKDFYNKNRKKPNQNYELKLVQIENRLASLKNIFERNGDEFYMVYYNVLEMIRSFHSQISDEAEIPFAKAYRVYTDPEYYNKFVSNNASNSLPDKEFVELYKNCIKIDEQTKMLENIQTLYNYEKQQVSINPEDYEIKL